MKFNFKTIPDNVTKYDRDNQPQGQTAIEYLLLLTVVAIIVIASFSNLLPRVKTATGNYFLKASASIMGRPVDTVSGNWCDWSTCHPCNCDPANTICTTACAASSSGTISTRLCDCPAPIGNDPSLLCSGSSIQPCP